MRSSGNNKAPCWELRDCQKRVHEMCPAYLKRETGQPCWALDDTMCDKLLDTPRTCDICIVYRVYHTK